jgi:hypothetical protein
MSLPKLVLIPSISGNVRYESHIEIGLDTKKERFQDFSRLKMPLVGSIYDLIMGR